MTTNPFICSKSGRPFSPDEGGKCHVCGKLFARDYLRMCHFEEGEYPVCVDDLAQIERRTRET